MVTRDVEAVDFLAASTASASILQLLVAVPPTKLEAVYRFHIPTVLHDH